MEKKSTRSLLTTWSLETVSTVESHTKEAVISVVLMERDGPNVTHKLHHFASACQSRKDRKQPTNFCENESGHSDSDNSVFMIEHKLNNVKMTKKQLSVQLALSHEKDKRGVPVECLLDTGTTCNVISMDDLNQISKNAVIKEIQT